MDESENNVCSGPTVNLSDSENPFKWKLNMGLKSNDAIWKFEYACRKFGNESFSFKKFTYELSLAYEMHQAGDKLESFNILKESERKFVRGEFEDFEWCRTIRDTLKHVLFSSLAYIYFDMGEVAKSEEMLDKIVPVVAMDECNRAAIDGIKANILMEYGNELCEQALQYAEKAISINPSDMHWRWLKGALLFRKRISGNNRDELPSIEEKEELELFRRSCTDPWYLVFLANVYRTTAKYVHFRLNDFRSNSSSRSSISSQDEVNRLTKLASEIYSECLKNGPSSASVLFHCADGFLKLPEPYRNVELSRKLIARGFQSDPNSIFGNRVKANCYEKFDRNFKSAKRCYQICIDGNDFYSKLDIIRVNYKLSGDHAAVINQLDQILNDRPRFYRPLVLCHKVSTLLLFTDDVSLVFECLAELMERNPHDHNLMNHFNVLQVMKYSTSLYELTLSKINALVKNDKLSAELKELCSEFLKKISALGICTVNIPDNLCITIFRGSEKNVCQGIINTNSNCDNSKTVNNYISYRSPYPNSSTSSRNRNPNNNNNKYPYIRGQHASSGNWRTTEQNCMQFSRLSLSTEVDRRNSIFGGPRRSRPDLYNNTIFTDAGNRHERIEIGHWRKGRQQLESSKSEDDKI